MIMYKDEISHFLENKEISTTPEFFLGTEINMGVRVVLPSFTFVYRYIEGRFIICDFSADDTDGNPVFGLMALLQDIVTHIKGIRYIDAMIFPSFNDRKVDLLRSRLTALMLSRGASFAEIENQTWLRIDLAGLKKRQST